MYELCLECDDCHATLEPRGFLGRCPRCGGLLEFKYDYAAIRAVLDWEAVRGRPKTIWRWHELLPVRDPESAVTMGEGGTPCLPSLHIGPSLGLRRLYLKNDTLMPTGSFKDRGFALSMNWAREWGIRRGITYTSGNAGHSFAAYGRRIGLEGLVMMRTGLAPERYKLQSLLGYPLVLLDFNSFAEVDGLFSRLAEEFGLMQFVNFLNPVRHEAMKTYAYELLSDLGVVPEHMVQPMGTGGGYWGAYKGFSELREMGFIDRLPALHVVQPQATPPVIEAYNEGRMECRPTGDPSATIASSIAADDPIGKGRRVLRALRATGGRAIAVSDDDLRWAMSGLGREGIWAEPAGAAAVAALRQLVATGAIQPNDRVVCVITGSGLKEIGLLPEGNARPPLRIQADPAAVCDALRGYWAPTAKGGV